MKFLLVLALACVAGYLLLHDGSGPGLGGITSSVTHLTDSLHGHAGGLSHSESGQAGDRASVQFATCPDGQGEALVLSVIDSAQSELVVAAYELTNRHIVSHLLARARAGVQVRVVLDRSQLDGRGSKLPELAAAGIPVRIDLAVPLMHDKFIVADRDTTQTGSMNYTEAGARHNAENVLVIWHHTAVAAAALSAWTKLWDESQPYQDRP
ncbi:phospholipase D family protein (plasmid) [Burkholderia plantarii]|uniref:phospholipase D family nuclease n=1 Tax=Burkholderia plantarii TaxID=41899 RepID=UPI00272B2480|nr:phospholipase D family protein [Burkholderia plantarii]WLE64121.1 phospholipase D family protein [Burkholderia plantarii]